MLARKNGIHHRFLLGGVGIKFAAHSLHSVDDVPCTTAACALEDGVFHKVSKPPLAGQLVATAGIHRQSAVSHLRVVGNVHHAESVRESARKYIVAFHCQKPLIGSFAGAKHNYKSVGKPGGKSQKIICGDKVTHFSASYTFLQIKFMQKIGSRVFDI